MKHLLAVFMLLSLSACGGPPSSLLGGHYGGVWGDDWGTHDSSGGVWGEKVERCKMYGNCGKDED
jgi:hypothetical protein